MHIKVVYNGNTEFYGYCSDPSVLRKGEVYTVIGVEKHEWYTNYTLNEVKGIYNAAWFEPKEKPVVIAIGNRMPILNEEYSCYKFESKDGEVHMVNWNTNEVISILDLSQNVVRVETLDATYIVQLK